MWTPTHVQVTVHRARNLIPKGKHGTNDAYVTIALGKEKFQTTVKERAENPEWHEECDMLLGDMTQCVTLNVYHRNLLGLDDFLGTVVLPLQQFQVYERPKSRWYSLTNKPSSKKAAKYRGEVEVKVTFLVHSCAATPSKPVTRSGSFKSLTRVGEKLHSKLEKRKSKDSDDLNKVDDLSGAANLMSSRQAIKDLAKSRTSPAKLDKLDRRRHSLHPEVLPTVPHFELSLNDAASQHSTSLSSSASSLSHSESSLSRQSTGRSSNPRLRGSPHTPRAAIENLAEQEEEGGSGKNEGGDKDAQEDGDYFSRTNSFRQAIGRGSIRRSSMRRGNSVGDKSAQDDLASFLMGGSAEEVGGSSKEDDSPKSQTSPPAKPPRRFNSVDSTPKSGTDRPTSPAPVAPAVEEEEKRSASESPRESAPVAPAHSMSDADTDNRRHTLDNRKSRVATHEMAETLAETRTEHVTNVPNEVLDQFKQHSREELIEMLLTSRQENARMRKEKHDLEDYLDNLLLRVMEVQPVILQNPQSPRRPRIQSQPITQPLSQSAPQTQTIDVQRYNQQNSTPSYPPPAYTHPSNHPNNPYRQPNNQQQRGKSPPKLIKTGQKRDKKTGNPFKRFSAAFK